LRRWWRRKRRLTTTIEFQCVVDEVVREGVRW